jgi:hypothetical protein
VKKIFFEFFVPSAAILDFRIFPEKSEEKKGHKKFVSVKIILSTEISDKNSHYFIYIDTFY